MTSDGGSGSLLISKLSHYDLEAEQMGFRLEIAQGHVGGFGDADARLIRMRGRGSRRRRAEAVGWGGEVGSVVADAVMP